MHRVMFHRDHEKGAVAIIVALLFGFGVMTAAAALTIDVGRINADRRQLQNGADAVALAAAQQCASNGTCSPTATNLQDLANANAADNATSIRRVDGGLPLLAPVISPPSPPYPAICGSAPGLLACNPIWLQSVSNLQECPKDPPAGVNYVRAYAETKNSAGDNILPYSFGAAIAGVGSGANQQACATVIYGPPSGAAAPITLSYCEWAAATGFEPATVGPPATLQVDGTYANEPSVGWPGYVAGTVPAPGIWPTPALPLPAVPVHGNEIIIGLQGTTTTSTCHTWNTHDAPGGFGYLAGSTSCGLTAPVDGWIKADTGNVLPAGCPSLLPYFNTVLYLPVFDCTVKVTGSVPIPTTPPLSTDSCIDGAGNNTYYHVQGYAKFYLSGYVTGGAGSGTDKNNDRTQTVTPQAPCSGSDRCLSGWFLKGLVKAPPTTSAPAGSPPLGAYSIQLAR